MAVDHYVPQFLLKNFSVDPNKPQVWAYDKSTGRSFRTNVRNIAAEKGFYRLEVGGRTLSLEEGLSTLEDKTQRPRGLDRRNLGEPVDNRPFTLLLG